MIIESKEGMANTILPDSHMVLAFCFRGKVTYTENNVARALPAAAITGLRQQARLLQYGEDTATLLVRFTETGAASFLPGSPLDLFNHTVALEHIMPQHDALFLCEQLAEAKTDSQRIAFTEGMLISLLDYRRADLLVHAAMDAIKLARGNVRIKELTAGLYISQDPFEKRFRQTSGTTPKHFAEIIRLRSLISNIDTFKNLGMAAHAFGFFDQAHFIRSFKAFTGQPPKAFFRNARYW